MATTKLHDFLTRPWEGARGLLVEELQTIDESIRILQEEVEDSSVARAQILNTTGTQHNYKLTDEAEILVVTVPTMIVTGLANVWDGRQLIILFSGTGSCQVQHESASSIINYRITCPSTNGLTVGTNGAIHLVYDASATRWRAYTLSAGTPITPTFVAGDYTAATGNWTLQAGDVTSFTFSQVNKILSIRFELVTTTVSATPATLNRILPAGFTTSVTAWNACLANDNGTKTLGIVTANAASDLLKFYSSGALGAWSAATNTTGVAGHISIEVD